MSKMSQSSNERIVMMLAAVVAATFFVSRAMDLVWLNVVLKPIPVLALWYLVSRWSKEKSTMLIGLGFGFSALGDVLLELPFDLFVFGLGAFLLAHLLYIGAFLLRSTELALGRLFPFVAWCGGMFMWMKPGLGPMLIPVAVYVTVIGTMLWRAAALFTSADPTTRWALTGAVIFAASDSILAINKFIEPFAGASYLIMVTYWGGQLCLALSTRPLWKKVGAGGSGR